jgi:integrase
MPKRILPLSDLQVKNAKPKVTDYKLSDGYGLHLLITPSGGKLWRFQYRFDNKQKILALGSYPSVTLSDARQRREDARKLLANAVDPCAQRKAQKECVVVQVENDKNTFEKVAKDWLEKNSPIWSDSHIKTITSRLERDVYPAFGSRSVTSITRNDVKSLMEKVAARGTIETADRIKLYCRQVLRYALNNNLIESNPVDDMKDILPKRTAGHHAALTDPKEVAPLLRAIDGFEGSYIVKCALQLAPQLFVRPGELRAAEWSNINLDDAEWRYYISKTDTNHIVPLSKQAVDILKALHPLTGGGKYVFPCHRSPLRCMSENALIAALRRMGYTKEEMTPHGFRATARTILDEVLHQRVDFIEHQLAHAVKDPNGRAYNRTAHLPERRKMMQLWSDYLDGLKFETK